MGCGPQKKAPSLTWANTDIGTLRVTLVDAFLPPEPKLQSPTVKVRVTNQYYTSPNLPGTKGQNTINEKYEFVVNSFYQAEGRAIQIGLFEKEKLVAYGLVDADPIIKKGKEVQEFRCMMTSDKQVKFGYVTVRASFEENPYTKVTFQFQTATIRKKTSAPVAIRATIGEEVLQTEYRKDLEESPPLWNDQQLTFLVPDATKAARIELIDDKDNVLGEAELEMEDILKTKSGEEVYAAEQLFYKEKGKEEKPLDAATLKYSYVLGSEASFSQVKDILKSSIRGHRSKKELQTAVIERVLEKPQ